jgi:hypothetical protein
MSVGRPGAHTSCKIAADRVRHSRACFFRDGGSGTDRRWLCYHAKKRPDTVISFDFNELPPLRQADDWLFPMVLGSSFRIHCPPDN